MATPDPGRRLTEGLLGLFTTRVGGALRSLLKGGFRSVLGALFSAFFGLILGALVGMGLAGLHRLLAAAPAGTVPGTTPGVGTGAALHVYLVVVSALGGLVAGWWSGLRRGLRRAIVDNPVVSEVVREVTALTFEVLEGQGLRGVARQRFLEEVQAAIDTRRADVQTGLTGTIGRVPLLGRVGGRLARRVMDEFLKTPQALLLSLEVRPPPGQDARRHIEQQTLRRIRVMLEQGVDAVVGSPLSITVLVAVLLAALPFVLLLL
jgi:hypothetical protein